MALKLHGVSSFRAALQEKILLAQYLFEQLSSVQGLIMGPQPQLSTVIFRRKTEEQTEQLLADILKSNTFWCNSTKTNGELFIRICILNFRTHLEEVNIAIASIKTLTL
jgi:aromatic-L-amino-acid/L-tryptophan decarboxylase